MMGHFRNDLNKLISRLVQNSQLSQPITWLILTDWIGLDWIEQCFTSPPTPYRLYGRWFLQVKRPNQQYQSTEGTYSTQTNKTDNNHNIDR